MSLTVALSLLAGCTAGEDGFDRTVRQGGDFGVSQLARTSQAIPAADRFPEYTMSSGGWVLEGADDWTSGFFPGALWLAYARTGDESLRADAVRRQAAIAGQRHRTDTHDLGFMLHDSFGNGLRFTGEASYRAVLLDAARSLSVRYSPTVRSIRSSGDLDDPEFRVIVDNLMNLELLFWGSRNGGDPAWRTMAANHALRTLGDHVRPDGSTYQRVVYDSATGAVKRKETGQGFSSGSTWSRGQAWAVYGYTVAWRESGDRRFLEAAWRTADWFLSHLPSDKVPYWDFDAPDIPDEPRDSSAAAIAASALLDLGRAGVDAGRELRYADGARAILTSLASPAYLAQGTSNPAILLHGTSNRNRDRFDTGLIYGDYYYLESLLRLRWLPPATGAHPVAGTTASEGDAGSAVDANGATAWTASSDGAWLEVDLGQGRTVSKVTVAWPSGGQSGQPLRAPGLG